MSGPAYELGGQGYRPREPDPLANDPPAYATELASAARALHRIADALEHIAHSMPVPDKYQGNT